MQNTQADFVESYRGLPDEEIAALYAEIDSLTEEARSALTAEMDARRLNGEQLTRIHAAELRHEAHFDRLESFRRKKLAFGRYSGMGLKDWLIALLIAVALILISKIVSHRH